MVTKNATIDFTVDTTIDLSKRRAHNAASFVVIAKPKE